MGDDFRGRTVIVTGGSRGIGRAIALGFARAGASVSICARNPETLRQTAGEIAALGGKVHFAPCDLADGEAIAGYVPEAAEALGGLDILVNNASGFGRGGDTDEAWQQVTGIDLLATVRASRAALPFLMASEAGAIVNISSISGLEPTTRNPAYAAAKAALIHYTRSQAAMFASDRIRVNGVAPGSTQFPGGSWAQRETANPELYNSTLATIPFGRFGKPEEIADAVIFLASPRASWITGQTIAVDGGQTLGA
jgi:3-oxoacyl-[acyl-carrier protein] reductase